jgi:hypothetical protein
VIEPVDVVAAKVNRRNRGPTHRYFAPKPEEMWNEPEKGREEAACGVERYRIDDAAPVSRYLQRSGRHYFAFGFGANVDGF